MVLDLLDTGLEHRKAARITNSEGWFPAPDEWTTPATVAGPPLLYTVAIPAGGANRYRKADKVRLSQDGGATWKYFFISAVADAALTLCAGTDYALTTATISKVSISRQDAPHGFPGKFDWTPTITNDGGAMETNDEEVNRASFAVLGQTVWVDAQITFDVAVAGYGMRITPPVAAAVIDQILCATVSESAAGAEGGIGRVSTTTLLRIIRYDAAALAVHDDTVMRITGVYRF